MSTEPGPAAPGRDQNDSEPLELRARPRPVTRINRKLLAGVIGCGLLLLAGLVMVALNPPSWRAASLPTELYNVDNKPKSDGLARLPATYEGVGSSKKDAPKGPDAAKLHVPDLDTERADADRGRLAKQAHESAPFFRLSLKTPAAEPRPDPVQRPDPLPRPLLLDGSALAGADRAGGATDATDQTRKLAFLKAGPEKEIYNPHALQRPVSPYQLLAGSIISASLVTGLNADLPGFVIAQVTEHAYDTVSGRHLLIPQGSRLIGKYDSVVAYGQERALVVWQRIIRPDGSSVVIDNLPATDTAGYAGLADAVDLHTWKLLKGVALATVLGVGSSLAFGSGSGDSDIIRALRESTGQTTNRAGQRLIERELNVQPTLTVRPGWPLRVIVHKDLVLAPYRDEAVK
ncbi:MAG: TrbI/VirB10 family protein [Hyphomicrobiaceae bacterium]